MIQTPVFLEIGSGTVTRLARVAFGSLLAAIACLVGNAQETPESPGAESPGPYPLDYFAMRSVISNVRVSPDGNHLALMKIATKDGNPIVEVYDAADLGKEPFRMDSDPMEIQYFSWVSDRDILFSLRQQVRDQIEGYNRGVFEFKWGMLDVEKKKLRSFAAERAAIVSVLPNKPNKVLLAMAEGGGSGPGAKLNPAFRPLAYYELDLRRGTKKLLIRGKISLGQIGFDGDGNPWLGRGFDEGTDEYVWYHRKLGESGWREILRHSEDSFESFGVAGFDVDDRNKLYVIANRGDDKTGLWLYDVDTGDYELLYRRSDVDVWGLVGHSIGWKHPDRIVGVAYLKGEYGFEFFDEIEGATRAQLAGIIPNAYNVSIPSRSRDGNTLVVANTGPQDPGTYYLLKGGRFQTIGSRQPLLGSDKLASLEFITYKARDGRKIPAWLTVPNGEPPFPLVVVPHGGPFVRESVVYHKWAQMLANNGYLVLQPQYRGSLNHGMEFGQAAFEGVSQGGRAMQDDKDDGALHLIKEGLTKRDRVAMFGWSYGGYAALVAASRDPQIYQCVIAAAAVSDPTMQVNYIRFRMRGDPAEQWIKYWDHAVSPLEEVEKVNVPLLIIHGDVDQRVPIAHAKKYLKLLDEHEKPYDYLELAGADHFSNTLFYGHQETLYQKMTDYLANDCGPGGL